MAISRFRQGLDWPDCKCLIDRALAHLAGVNYNFLEPLRPASRQVMEQALDWLRAQPAESSLICTWISDLGNDLADILHHQPAVKQQPMPEFEGLDGWNIRIIMDHAKCSRSDAINALGEHGSVIKALLSLTP